MAIQGYPYSVNQELSTDLHFHCKQPNCTATPQLPTPKHLMLKPTLKVENCGFHINSLQLITIAYLSENCYHQFFPSQK